MSRFPNYPSLCCLSLFLAMSQCSKPLSQPVDTYALQVKNIARVGPMVYLGFTSDKVSLADGPPVKDLLVDAEFRVRISGEVTAFVLTLAKLDGSPTPGGQWDTIVGEEPFHRNLQVSHPQGSLTASIAVHDHQGVLLNPLGKLPKQEFHDEELSIFVADPNRIYMNSGQTLVLLVLRPNGTVDRTTVTLL